MMMIHFKTIDKNNGKNKINVNILAKSVAADFIGYRVSKPNFRDVRNADAYQVKVFKALMQVDVEFYERFYKESAEGIDESKSSVFHKAKKMIFE